MLASTRNRAAISCSLLGSVSEHRALRWLSTPSADGTLCITRIRTIVSAVIFSPVSANTQGYHSVNYKDYGAIINAAWENLVGHVTDPVEKMNILKPIIEWGAENPVKDKNRSTKAIVNNMRHAAEQFTGLVCPLSLPFLTALNILFFRRRPIIISRRSRYLGLLFTSGPTRPQDRSRCCSADQTPSRIFSPMRTLIFGGL